jgi:uncharacterized protein YrrD
MLHRATELIGKPVIAADTGEKLGSVADLLLDHQQMVGLVVRSGVLRTEHVLPSEEVQTFGRDAVVSRSAAALVNRRDWRDRQNKPLTDMEGTVPETPET